MGIGPYSSCSNTYSIPNSNPDPKKFNVFLANCINGNLIIGVNYPGCTNFEGNKILVYKGIKNLKELLIATQGELDPHFSKEVSPIARFKPNQEGLNLAEKLCLLMENK